MTIRLFLKITPNARVSGFNGKIEIDSKTYIKLGLKAQPIDGKANEELIKFLAKFLGTSKDSINITSGLTNKYKTVTIDTENPEILTIIKALTTNDN